MIVTVVLTSATGGSALSYHGVMRRGFFVPGTKCQALRGGSAWLACLNADARRPQSFDRYARVPGTGCVQCLTPRQQGDRG